jgi:Probable cobalt transporter subunit (CbtB)
MMVLAAAMVVYLMAMENGATLHHGAMVLHEFFHDGRHFLAFPCH